MFFPFCRRCHPKTRQSVWRLAFINGAWSWEFWSPVLLEVFPKERRRQKLQSRGRRRRLNCWEVNDFKTILDLRFFAGQWYLAPKQPAPRSAVRIWKLRVAGEDQSSFLGAEAGSGAAVLCFLESRACNDVNSQHLRICLIFFWT